MMIKQTIIAFAIIMGICGFFVGPTVSAAKCGGVETSVIDCEQTGMCPGGENAYEGGDPGTDSTKLAKYKTDHGHEYGKCVGGGLPDKRVEKEGIWGLLMLAINIMSAGIAVVAVGGVVRGAILYTTAGGSLDQVKKGREVIANTALGILLYALMYAFMNFIIPGGLFTP